MAVTGRDRHWQALAYFGQGDTQIGRLTCSKDASKGQDDSQWQRQAEWQTLTYFKQGDIQIGCSDKQTCLTYFGYKEPTSPSKHYLSQKLGPPTSSWDFW